jgi:hypothetical protein
MKKYIVTAAALMFLAPITASATQIGTGSLIIDYSKPIIDRYYGDYDVRTYSHTGGTEIKLANDNSNDGKWEAFCISKDELKNYTPYDQFTFYTSDYLIGKYNQSNSSTQYDQNTVNFVTWAANWSTTTNYYNSTFSTQDKVKGLGQGAIWYALGVDTNVQAGIDYNLLKGIFSTATDKSDYTSQWLVAMNGNLGPATRCDISNQDFLIKASPVPVPSSILLLGSGLLGLIGVGRRKQR